MSAAIDPPEGPREHESDSGIAAINAPEQVCDPLEGLVEKTSNDPGAPFAAEALQRLATLKNEDRCAFEALRATAGAQLSAPSAHMPTRNPANGFGAPHPRTVANDADGKGLAAERREAADG
jgi:hypothetical protein